MNYYRHFIGDYLRKTVHLTMILDGAYRRLLDEYYVTEQPLTLDRALLYGRVRAKTKKERDAVDFIVKNFFIETLNGFANCKADEEIFYATSRANTARTNGLAGGRRTQRVPSGLAKVATPSLTPQTLDFRLQTPEPNQRENLKTFPQQKALGSIEFQAFWDGYPRKLDKQESIRAWIKGTCDRFIGEILAGLESWKRCEQWLDPERIPYPTTWLNKRRWKEAPIVTARKETLHEQLERLGAKP